MLSSGSLESSYQTWLLLFPPMDECIEKHQTIAELFHMFLSPLPRDFAYHNRAGRESQFHQKLTLKLTVRLRT